MLDIVDRPSECSDCARYLKEIAELKRAFLEADVESVRRCMQLEDEISELNDECSYTYGQLEDAKAALKRLKAGAPDPSNIRNKEDGF
jgi:hypothetical protein